VTRLQIKGHILTTNVNKYLSTFRLHKVFSTYTIQPIPVSYKTAWVICIWNPAPNLTAGLATLNGISLVFP